METTLTWFLSLLVACRAVKRLEEEEIMGSIGVARSILRSTSVRNATKKLAGEAKASPFRLPGKSPAPAPPGFLLRSPVEMSFGVESLLPRHSATASALMTSMLSVSLRGYGWLSEAGIVDV